MSDSTTHVAVDIGASGGTVYLGSVSEAKLAVMEVSRFDNGPIERGDRYVWDVDALRERIISGLRAADRQTASIDTVGIDTWGLDFGLLSDGQLLRAPTAYRDPRAAEAREELFETVGKKRLFEATGITNWNTPNTLWQLATIARREPEFLERADSLLMMPQLLSVLLGGDPAGEVTVASTGQLVDPERRIWATELLADCSLPSELLPTLDEPGEHLGHLSTDVTAELTGTPELVTPASHDTAAAVAGLPLSEDACFLNTGTWFILGVERDTPVLTEAAFDGELSNELGVDGTVRLLKNVTGFFLLEECRKAWRTRGEPVGYDELIAAGRRAPALASLVDPDDPTFEIGESMPDRIREYCRRTDQPVPTSQGAVVRCLLDSLVTSVALGIDELAAVVDQSFSRIHLGGGGVRNELFCQLLADATGRPVVAGPVEATAIGNLLTQAVAVGTLTDVERGRRLVAETVSLATYYPTDSSDWVGAKERLRELAGR